MVKLLKNEAFKLCRINYKNRKLRLRAGKNAQKKNCFLAKIPIEYAAKKWDNIPVSSK